MKHLLPALSTDESHLERKIEVYDSKDSFKLEIAKE